MKHSLPPHEMDGPWQAVDVYESLDERWLDDVEIPGGDRFEHHVVRMRPTVTAAVLDETAEHVLLLWRHRFISEVMGMGGAWRLDQRRRDPRGGHQA